MTTELPLTLPEPHRDFIAGALPVLQADLRIVGLAAGGSFLSDTMDEFSDLDLVIAVEPQSFEEVLAHRKTIAASLGRLLGSFTGEHVNEPRLLICLFDGDPPLHVDLKFVRVDGLAQRVEDPFVLWARSGLVAQALSAGQSRYPQPDISWIQDRFWIWLHYATSKVARGELFEALDFLAFLRASVFGPLLLRAAGARPSGVRKVEQLAGSAVPRLLTTVAAYDRSDCLRALHDCATLFQSLREDLPEARKDTADEEAALAYLRTITRRFPTAS